MAFPFTERPVSLFRNLPDLLKRTALLTTPLLRVKNIRTCFFLVGRPLKSVMACGIHARDLSSLGT